MSENVWHWKLKNSDIWVNSDNLSLLKPQLTRENIIECPKTETKENLPEKVTKKSKKKSKKKKNDMPRDDILTEKAVQRATEILEMLTDWKLKENNTYLNTV